MRNRFKWFVLAVWLAGQIIPSVLADLMTTQGDHVQPQRTEKPASSPPRSDNSMTPRENPVKHVMGAVLSGGGSEMNPNRVEANFGTIGGGLGIKCAGHTVSLAVAPPTG